MGAGARLSSEVQGGLRETLSTGHIPAVPLTHPGQQAHGDRGEESAWLTGASCESGPAFKAQRLAMTMTGLVGWLQREPQESREHIRMERHKLHPQMLLRLVLKAGRAHSFSGLKAGWYLLGRGKAKIQGMFIRLKL